MTPKTPDAMIALLIETGKSRAYGDITTAARRKRLTEHDIRLIERNVIDMIKSTPEMADEFQTFEIEPAFAKARDLLKQYFDIAQHGRAREIAEKP